MNECQLVDGRRVRQHQDQLRKREVEVTPPIVREGLSCGEGLPEMVDSFQKAIEICWRMRTITRLNLGS